ncbi:major facilitator superfamily domain-containing protein [Aspergillus lucknowensis]|uniref:Major facilitator superfamily domain-containing protein n=1 Tax=Aspergillus lucknowensis TaxID=176173 RepID=A0ABR4LXA7_9EURO
MEKPSAPRPSEPTGVDFKAAAEATLIRDVDLGEVLAADYTPEQERRVVRKLDLALIPIMGIVYMMQYMDKVALSQATLLNLREDLNLQGQEYSWTSAIFYFGYLAWSWPSSYLLVRLPLAKYMGISVFFWGGILMCHAAAKGFDGLMAVRFFLGVGEAVIGPGFALSIGMFYTREEQPARQAAWFVGNGVSNLISGLVAYGIGNVQITSITNWQLLFLILGTITALLSLLIAFVIPDKPQKAIFLTRAERAIAVRRTVRNKTGVNDTGRWRWDQAWMTIRDPQTWFLFLYSVSTNLCNGGITSFSALIINGFGYGRVRSLLMQMPLGAAQLVFLVLTTGFATLLPNTRVIMMIFNTSVSLMGMILVWKLDASHAEARVAGLALSVVFAANTPLSLSLISSNVAGFTKRSFTSAFIFIGYCVGNIAGPQFFYESEEPQYQTGMTASVAGLAFGVLWLILLWLYYFFENKRRDARYGTVDQLSESEEVAQGLSNKTDLEIESFRYVL